MQSFIREQHRTISVHTEKGKTVREKLIDVLGDFPLYPSTMRKAWMPQAVEKLADHLIANGVTVQDVPDINVGNISNRTPQLAIFDFRAFLNISMLLTESENA